MTTAQKIIKYFAMAFAVFLIFTIISAILTGGYVLLKAFGLIHTDKDIVTEDLKVISSEIKEISTLKIDLAYTNLDIKTGENFKVETNNSEISFANNNGSVKIKIVKDSTTCKRGQEYCILLYSEKKDNYLQNIRFYNNDFNKNFN